MARHRIHFPPPSLRCPHRGGRAQGLLYHSTYRTHDGPRRLWQYAGCGRCLSERRGTAFFNLKTAEADELAHISTSLLEWQNGTARSRNRYLVRKTYGFAKLVMYQDGQCEVDKTFYNFCRRHRGLRGETPAMRQRITNHVWSVAEVLSYRSASP